MPNDTTVQSNNYNFKKILRTGASPLMTMIGTSSYYGQLIGNPILGSINALLFSKKLGIDIWNLNQMPSTKNKLLNSSKKIVLGLGTIALVNYAKFTTINVIPRPTTTPIPIISTTTDTPPWLMLETNNNKNYNQLMDWDTFISLNSYGIANLVTGILELIPNKFETIRRIANMATGGCLISSGVAMGINNDFMNAYAVPNILAGASEIIHNLLPMQTNHNSEEMQETSFTNDHARLINVSVNDYGSRDSLASDIIYERQPIYQL